jgi:ubiquinone/menaquinone biosynthesis C-methylase UbiE
MSTNRYTPGHTSNATDFMSRRSVQSHGAFFMPHLTNGLSVLDCGCGPGSITLVSRS